MSLYGYPREPDAADVEVPVPHVPLPRVASEPVAVPNPLGPAAPPLPDVEPKARPQPEPDRQPPAFGSTFGQPVSFSDSQPHSSGDTPSGAFGDSWNAFGGINGSSSVNGSARATESGAEVGEATAAAAGVVDWAAAPPAPVSPAEPAWAPASPDPAWAPTSPDPAWAPASPDPAWAPASPAEPTWAIDPPGTSTQRVEPTTEPAEAPSVTPPAVTAPAVTPPPVIPPIRFDLPSDEPEIAPWDRKPLMIVIAGAAVLVLIAILSGAASAAMFPGPTVATWKDTQSEPQPSVSGAPAPAAPPVNDVISLSGVGDVIMGAVGYGVPANDGAGFFDPVKSALAADVVMGNLETPLTDDTGVGKCGTPPADQCFQLYLPPGFKNPLKDAGFQVLNLANNHTQDMGPQGLTNTRAALDSVGIAHTGAPGQITTVTVKGTKVAVLGFSVYSWGASLLNIGAAADLVRQAAAQADLVVIQMQGGAEGTDKAHIRDQAEEFYGENRGELIKFAHAVVDAGADVVFGHGPHVMRGMEFYKGRLIAYSLGNFCGYRVLSSNGFSGVGGILKVSLHKDGRWAGGTLVPTEMVNGGFAAVDQEKRALDFVAGLSRDDFGGSAATLSATDGAITPPAGT